MFLFLLGVAGRRSDCPSAQVFHCFLHSGPYHHLSIDAMLSFGSTDLLAVCAPPAGAGFLALQISKPSGNGTVYTGEFTDACLPGLLQQKEVVFS